MRISGSRGVAPLVWHSRQREAQLGLVLSRKSYPVPENVWRRRLPTPCRFTYTSNSAAADTYSFGSRRGIAMVQSGIDDGWGHILRRRWEPKRNFD